MADLTDVMNALRAAVEPVALAVAPCKVYLGSPHPQELEQALRVQLCHISITPTNRGGKRTDVPISPLITVAEPEITLEAEASSTQLRDGADPATPASATVTFSGAIGDAAHLMLNVDGNYVTLKAVPGWTLADLVDAYVTAINADAETSAIVTASSAGVDGEILTLTAVTPGEVGNAIEFWLRIGGTGTVAQKIRQQQATLIVNVWGYDDPSRVAFAQAIDNALAQTRFLEAVDTSQIRLLYEDFDQTDLEIRLGVYRRGLLYRVEYNTIRSAGAYTVLEAVTTVAPGSEEDA